LTKFLEKIISAVKLRGVVASSMSLVLYKIVGQKFITAVITTNSDLINLNIT
jgi:hypothetical protein